MYLIQKNRSNILSKSPEILVQYFKKDFFLDIESLDLSDLKPACARLKITENRLHLIKKKYFKSKYVFLDFWNDYFKNKRKKKQKPAKSTSIEPQIKRHATHLPKIVKPAKKLDESITLDLEKKETIPKNQPQEPMTISDENEKSVKKEGSALKIIDVAKNEISVKEKKPTEIKPKSKEQSEPFKPNNAFTESKPMISKPNSIHPVKSGRKRPKMRVKEADLPVIAKAKKYPSNRRFKDEPAKPSLRRKKTLLEDKLFKNKSKSRKKSSKFGISSTRKVKKPPNSNRKALVGKSLKTIPKKKSIISVNDNSRLTIYDRKKSLLNELKKNSKSPQLKKNAKGNKNGANSKRKPNPFKQSNNDKKKRQF